MGYRVEELAELTGLSIDTIRFYQTKQLLPAPDRDGRRALYDEQHLARLQEIRRLADEGFTLAQIERLSSSANPLLETLAELDEDLLTAEQVAERANVAPMVVDLVASTGLLRAVETSSGPRFDASAVEMLTAASAVVGAGVPITDLLTLARDHAANIDRIADAAVDLFREHVHAGTDHDDQLAGVVRSLLPQVTRLVAQHFERTLVERALAAVGDGADARVLEALASSGATAMGEVDKWVAQQVAPISEEPEPAIALALVRAEQTGRTQYVAMRTPVAAPADLLALAGLDAEQAYYWCHPDGDVEASGDGAVVVLDDCAGPDRFDHAAAAIRGLRDDLHLAGAPGPAGAGPILAGGFSFFGQPPSEQWIGFGETRLVLAERGLVRHGESVWLTVTTAVEAGQAVGDILRELNGLRDGAVSALDAPAVDADRQVELEPVDRSDYEALVTSAVETIRGGALDKVVVARPVTTTPAPCALGLLRSLRSGRPNCATVGFRSGMTWFVASTPELLIRLDEGNVATSAVAATVARTGDDAADQLTLTSDQKQLAEHRYVVEAIRARLEASGVSLQDATGPGVLELPGLLHLFTPIRGEMHRRDTGVVDLAGVLHPTPAVSGTPRRVAEEWLLEHEGLDRGWYASPVGLVDLRGDGEFWVGLRSALLTPEHAVLYSGAGIVAQSDPAAEFDETETKLEAMARAMGAR